MVEALYIPEDPVAGGTWTLEAKHTWNDEVTLNDPEAWPLIKVKKITGLRSLPDAPEDDSTDATARTGEVALTRFRRGKTVTYEGFIRGRTEAELAAGCTSLLAAFAPMDIGEMVIEPHPDYSSGSRLFSGRCRLLDIPDELGSPWSAHHGHERAFALGLRLYDPRIFDGAEVTGETPSTTTPRQVIVTNNGTADADALIDIYGVAVDPIIENLTLDKSLHFQDIALASTDFLRVDFRNRTVQLNGDEGDMRSKLDLVASDWWDAGIVCLAPGPNTIKLRPTGASNPAHLVVTFQPAYWG